MDYTLPTTALIVFILLLSFGYFIRSVLNKKYLENKIGVLACEIKNYCRNCEYNAFSEIEIMVLQETYIKNKIMNLENTEFFILADVYLSEFKKAIYNDLYNYFNFQNYREIKNKFVLQKK